MKPVRTGEAERHLDLSLDWLGILPLRSCVPVSTAAEVFQNCQLRSLIRIRPRLARMGKLLALAGGKSVGQLIDYQLSRAA